MLGEDIELAAVPKMVMMQQRREGYAWEVVGR